MFVCGKRITQFNLKFIEFMFDFIDKKKRKILLLLILGKIKCFLFVLWLIDKYLNSV